MNYIIKKHSEVSVFHYQNKAFVYLGETSLDADLHYDETACVGIFKCDDCKTIDVRFSHTHHNGRILNGGDVVITNIQNISGFEKCETLDDCTDELERRSSNKRKTA